MSGSDHAILDLGEDELQFTTNDYKSQSNASLTEFPSPGGSPDRDTDHLISDGPREESGQWKTSNFWTLGFYQQFFDVDTTDVKRRLLYSMVPIPGKSFLQHHIRPRPDLYGPFWICVTLVFSIAISGNLADFLQKSVDQEQTAKWHYDFHKVTLAATAVFSYAGFVPAALYGFLWWSGAAAGAATLTFLELVCLYGYSLAIYIPVSLLWLIQVSWWQWICVLVGAGLSGSVLFLPIWPAVRDQAAKSAVLVMVVVLALHLLLACGFMLYFFHVPAVTPGAGGHNVTETNQDTPNLGMDKEVLQENKSVKEDKNAKEAVISNASEDKRSNKKGDVEDPGNLAEGNGSDQDQSALGRGEDKNVEVESGDVNLKSEDEEIVKKSGGQF